MYPSKKGGVSEVCLSLQKAFEQCGLKVTLVTSYMQALKLCFKQKNKNSKLAITNLQFGFFGLFFKQSIFILHGYPQRKHESYLKYKIVVKGHQLFAALNKKTVAVSHLTKFVCANFYNIKVHKVIHNILPFEFVKKIGNLEITKVPNSVTFIGRVLPEKGVENICKAVKKIRDEKNKRIVLQIIGDGNLLPYLKAKYNHADNLFFGYVTDEQKVLLLASSHSFISLHPAEPFGITALEAGVLGANCCLSAIGGHTEFLSHHHLYPINDVNDVDEIAKVIDISLIEPTKQIQLSALLEKISTYYNQYAQQYLSIFNTPNT